MKELIIRVDLNEVETKSLIKDLKDFVDNETTISLLINEIESMSGIKSKKYAIRLEKGC